MRAVVLAEDRSLEQREVEEPTPVEGQVRVRVDSCGICGSDLHMRPSEALPIGSIMGHELSGVVDLVGPGVTELGEGERVCVYPFRPIEGHDLEIAMTTGIGLGQFPGGYAEAVCVNADMVWRLPDDVDLEHGALVEPLAVALHGVDVSGAEPGVKCAVIGAGPIGLMTALALRARGVEDIVVIEKNERRVERMRRLGFPAVSLEGAHEAVLGALGGPPAVVLECAGNPAAPGLAIELVAASGVVVLLGVLEEPVEISQLLLMLKEAQIRASFAYRPSSFDEAIELIRSGAIPADDLITDRVPLDRVDSMFDELLRPDTEHVKVLLKP